MREVSMRFEILNLGNFLQEKEERRRGQKGGMMPFGPSAPRTSRYHNKTKYGVD